MSSLIRVIFIKQGVSVLADSLQFCDKHLFNPLFKGNPLHLKCFDEGKFEISNWHPNRLPFGGEYTERLIMFESRLVMAMSIPPLRVKLPGELNWRFDPSSNRLIMQS